MKIWGAPSFPGTFSSRGRAQPLRGNGCSWTGQGEAWELVGLNTPLHCLGDEAKVIQLVSRSKGTAPAGDPGFGCDDRHLHPPEEKALELGCPAGPASGRFVCCRENRDSQGSWPVSAQGFPAGREGPLPSSFLSTPSSGKTKTGGDSFCLNLREILSAVTWTPYSTHRKLSHVPLYPQQQVLAPAFVPFLFS